MKFKNLQEFGARLGSNFPSLREHRLHIVVFVLMFLVFFTINHFLLKVPETLRKMLNASPMAQHITYTGTAVHAFPLELEIEEAALVDPALNDVVLRFEKLIIRPVLLSFLTDNATVRITALAGDGSATMDASTDKSFDFSSASFTLDMENLPLPVLKILKQFAPGVNAPTDPLTLIKGKPTWASLAALLIPRGYDLTANGRITMAPTRNSLAALSFEQFRLDSADNSYNATLKGRALIDRRNTENSELDLTAEIKAGPEHVAPALLMNDEALKRMELGQPLSFALQGTTGNVRVKPVF